MRYLILLLFISSLAFGQTRQGYYNASINGERVGSNRTTLEKAYTDALILKQNNPNEIVRVLPPDGWTVVLPVEFNSYVLPLYVSEIYLEKVNNTLDYINFKINADKVEEVYFYIGENGVDWIQYNITESVNNKSVYTLPQEVDKNKSYLYYLEIINGSQVYKTDELNFKLN